MGVLVVRVIVIGEGDGKILATISIGHPGEAVVMRMRSHRGTWNNKSGDQIGEGRCALGDAHWKMLTGLSRGGKVSITQNVVIIARPRRENNSNGTLFLPPPSRWPRPAHSSPG